LLVAQAESSFAWAALDLIPATGMIETTITFTTQTRGVGLLLRADNQLNSYYQVRLEPGFNRVVFDRSPRPGDEPPIVERPLHLEAGQPVHIRVLIEGTVVVAYINNQVAFCTRGYEHVGGSYGLFVSEGSAEFQETKLYEVTL
jgi:beta-fructofuranosidase